MTHGAVLQNETGLPYGIRPLLIAPTIKCFFKKSRKKYTPCHPLKHRSGQGIPIKKNIPKKQRDNIVFGGMPANAVAWGQDGLEARLAWFGIDPAFW